MVKDDLKVKIKMIWIWTIIGIGVFLIISFFLKSSYPISHYKFNLSDAYDVLKDALTLAAAFLAPIAALVVFNDWRETHARITNEKLSSEVIEIFREMNFITTKGYNEYANDKVLNKSDGEKISILLKDLISKLSRINNVDEEAQEFKNLAYTMRNIFLDWWNYINIASEDYIDINFTGLDQKAKDVKFHSMNENGVKAQTKAILFSEKFYLIEPLLV